MKKACACLLAVCLLLTLFAGCELPFELPGGKPQETAEPTSEGGEKPQQGEHVSGGVWVDDSYYTPRDNPTPVYTRLREDRIEDLEAGDYGLILPFAGVPIRANNEGGYSWYNDYLCGFVTADGTIVCDPVYSSVSEIVPYSDADAGRTQPAFWRFSRMTEIREYDEGDYVWRDGVFRCGAASFDGRVVTPCVFVTISWCEDGFIAEREDGVYEVYNSDGSLRFTTAAFPRYAEREGYCYLRGVGSRFIYLARSNDADGESVWLLDRDGVVRFGPCEQIEDPSEGLYPVRENGLWGYLDVHGGWVLAPAYTGANAFNDGLAVVQFDEWTTGVINRDGKEILSVTDNGWLNCVGGLIIQDRWDYDTGADTITVYDRTGRELLDGAWTYCTDGLVIEHWSDGGGPRKLKNLQNGAEAVFEDLECLEYERIPYRGQTCWCAHDTEGGSILLNEQLEVVGREPGSPYSVTDPVTGEVHLAWRIYDEGDAYTVTELWTGDSPCWRGYEPGQYRFVNGLLMLADAAACTVTAPDGTVVFRYPFEVWDD